MSDDEDTYEIPLQDQRVFGAGIKRQRVRFVPSSSAAALEPSSKSSGKSISDLYLNLVLSKEALPTEEGVSSSSSKSTTQLPAASGASTQPPDALAKQELCDICRLPLVGEDTSVIEPDTTGTAVESLHVTKVSKSNPTPHEASLAHQVCLTHSHPPSHLDRNRKGLAYLSAYGWDPDSRRGLGSEGQGIQFPIKSKPKDDKLGIGVVLPKEGEIRRKEKIKTLDAGKIRKMHAKDKKRTERLREMFYQNDDVERYLNGG